MAQYDYRRDDRRISDRLARAGLMAHLAFEPMTLGNMRANGVRSLAIHCGGRFCWHSAVLNADGYRDDLPVPAFGPRMVCTVCGAIGADARPNWNEKKAAVLFGKSGTINLSSSIASDSNTLA